MPDRSIIDFTDCDRGPHGLREGFTTGSAASAAAVAALNAFLSGQRVPWVDVPVPPDADGHVPDRVLRVPIHQNGTLPGRTGGFASVIKDGGDDPDATNGMRLIALVGPKPWASALPPVDLDRDILLYAGLGIGGVTLPGLPVPPGQMAVNPAPRRQIAESLRQAALGHGYGGPIHCRITVPHGRRRALGTLNARLGILGGISILGTRGTVRPFSTGAWQSTITQGLDVARAVGCDTVCLTTGGRSEKAMQRLFPDLPAQAFVQAADFAGFSLEQAAWRGFRTILWGCFPGKLLKLAQGLAWTHAHGEPADFGLLATVSAEAGVPPDVIREAVARPTVSGALERVAETDPALHEAVLRRLAAMALESARSMVLPVGHRPNMAVYVFNFQGRLLTSRGDPQR